MKRSSSRRRIERIGMAAAAAASPTEGGGAVGYVSPPQTLRCAPPVFARSMYPVSAVRRRTCRSEFESVSASHSSSLPPSTETAREADARRGCTAESVATALQLTFHAASELEKFGSQERMRTASKDRCTFVDGARFAECRCRNVPARHSP